MGRFKNVIVDVLIVLVIIAVCSVFFYKRGQESGWQLAQQLIPLEKGEIYLCVEKTGAKGVKYLTVQEVGTAARDKTIDQKELRFRLGLAQNGVTLQEYNDKYRGGKKGF